MFKLGCAFIVLVVILLGTCYLVINAVTDTPAPGTTGALGSGYIVRATPMDV